MPITAMNKNDLPSGSKNQIWFPGEFLIVQPVPKSQRVDQTANSPFRFRSF